MDTYQPIYDAVRSKISNGNIGDTVENICRDAFDMSHVKAVIQQEFGIAASEMARPSAIYRPSLGPDGNKWCALYGENLMEGVAGFGDTPEEAMRAFDQAWMKEKTPTAVRLAKA